MAIAEKCKCIRKGTVILEQQTDCGKDCPRTIFGVKVALFKQPV